MIYGNQVECECGEEIPQGRLKLGYTTCVYCGEIEARKVKHCVAIPYNKGAYQYISDVELLKQTNPKRTT